MERLASNGLRISLIRLLLANGYQDDDKPIGKLDRLYRDHPPDTTDGSKTPLTDHLHGQPAWLSLEEETINEMALLALDQSQLMRRRGEASVQPISQFDDRFVLSWERAARLSAEIETAQPHIHVDFGTLLSLEDLFASILATGNFLVPPAEDRPNGEVRSRGFGRPHLGRFLSYNFRRETHPMTKVMRLVPLDSGRVAQWQLLSELAFHFILLHEKAHWYLGHCALSAEARLSERAMHSLKVSPEKLGMASNTVTIEIGPAMEKQADSFALSLALMLFLEEAPAEGNPFLKHHSMMFSLGTEGEGWLDTMNSTGKIRALLVAAGAVMLLFERARGKLGATFQGYPSPASRLLTLLVSAARFARDAAQMRVGEDPDQLVETQIMVGFFEALPAAINDFGYVAKALDIDAGLFDRERFGGHQSMTDLETAVINLAFGGDPDARGDVSKIWAEFTELEALEQRISEMMNGLETAVPAPR